MKKALWSILILSIVVPLSALGQEKKEREAPSEQAFLDLKPRQLLPSNTKLTSSNIKVVLRPAKDEDLLVAVAPGTDYNLQVTILLDEKGNMKDVESLVWSKNAVHEIRENISFAGYDFHPKTGAPLVFKVIPDKGYVFVDGNGTVVRPDKKRIDLSDKNKGLAIGRPVRDDKSTEQDKSGAVKKSR